MDKAWRDLEKRVLTLEAENKELRRLWIDNEGDLISLSVKLDKFINDDLYPKPTLIQRISDYVRRIKGL